LGHALVRVSRTSDLRETNHGVNPRLLPTFSFWAACGDLRSTGNKQTLNGLFYLIAKEMFPSAFTFQRSFSPIAIGVER
jgi:hypothetical protein